MKYCSECGSATENRIPPEDNRPRAICTRCSRIHYVNPKVVVGSMSTWENKILLCKRAIDPRKGFWTLPAGFMEIGESTSEGAKRETVEESGADVELTIIFVLIVSELFSEEEIPWSELSFTSVKKALELFYEKTNPTLPRVHTALITSK